MSLNHTPSEIYDLLKAQGRLGLLSANESWGRVPLGEVVEVQNGLPFDSKKFNAHGDGIPLLRIRDIGRDAATTYFAGDVPPEYMVNSGDLLVGMDGDFRIAEWHGAPAALNQRVCRLIPNVDRINPKFMLFHLQGWLDAIGEHTSSTTVKHLSSKTIQQIPFPLPPLEHQQQIVERVEAALANLESLSEQLEEVSRKTVLLRRAALLDAHKVIGDTVGTREESLKSLGNWVGGSTPSKSKGEYWIDGSIPWITSKDVKSEFLDGSIVNVTDRAIGPSLLKVHPAGSIVLVARSGILEHTLPIAMATVDFTLNQDLKACITRDDVYPEWLFRYLQAHEKELLQRYRKAGTTVANLNFDEFLQHKVAVPSPAAQRAICDKISQQMSIVDEIAMHANRRLSEIEQLRRAVLHQAFTEREVG